MTQTIHSNSILRQLNTEDKTVAKNPKVIYAMCSVTVILLIAVNVCMSVFSMYNGSEQKVLTDQKSTLHAQNTQLELELAQIQTRSALSGVAEQNGFVYSTQVKHVSFPTSEAVAQR